MSSGRLPRWAAAGALLILGFLPLVNWIPGGHEAPWYPERAGGWLRDGALVVLVGLLLALLSRRLPSRWRLPWFESLGRSAAQHPLAASLVLGAGALALYATISQLVLSARPLLIDEIIQVWQGRVLASGRLWVPTPESPEFTSAMHLVDHQGRRFGQFPMGGPAMLALGSLVRLEWLVGPLFGALSAVLVWSVMRRIEARPGVALGAAALFAVAPFTAFMAGSHMNHVTTLTWLLVGMLGLARVVAATPSSWRDGLLCGLGFGVAATIRPVDALAFALPAALWLGGRAWRSRQPATFLASGLGVALPAALLLAANSATTGHPLLFGYTVMWGSAHDLGFHATPWGSVHTPLQGLELVNLYFLRLQQYFLEAPIPALLPAAVALFLTPRLSPFDRYLLAASGLLVALYFAYWHDGFFLGPRFMYPLAPVLALWTARVVPALRGALGDGLGMRFAVCALAGAVPFAVHQAVAVRAAQYGSGLQTMRFNPDAAARSRGIRDALILVRESWGAEVMVRLWAAGISRGEAEQFYRRIDTCQLDQALGRIEAAGISGAAALQQLEPLLADSALVLSSTLSPDFTERMLPGAQYPPACMERLRQDGEGFTLFAPFLLAGADGNRYLRDLHGRNAWPGWQGESSSVFLLRPPGPRVGVPPEFVRRGGAGVSTQPPGPGGLPPR